VIGWPCIVSFWFEAEDNGISKMYGGSRKMRGGEEKDCAIIRDSGRLP